MYKHEIIWKNGDITLERGMNGMYAIFERVKNPSGTTAFWQQRTKWYARKGYCEKIWTKMVATAIVNHTYKKNVKVGECII